MGMFDRPKGEDDRVVFVEETHKLLQPHVEDVLKTEGLDRGCDLTTEEDVREVFDRVHIKMLGRFYDLAKTEPALNKFMFPIMMYLRSSRKRDKR